MAHTVVELRCPNCNATVRTDQKECDYCHKPVIISTFNSVYSMPKPIFDKYLNTYRKALDENPDNTELNKSIALCYLKLKLYDKALPAFEKAIEDDFDDSEVFFYAAICLLKGKKAFLAQRSDIDRAVEYLNAAIMIEPKGIYYYLLAYIKYDYFERKYLNTFPDYEHCFLTATQIGVSQFDCSQMFSLIGVSPPSVLCI